MVDNRCSGHIARAIFMRLARRSPLAGGLAELQHVHELLYSDDTTSMAAGSAAVRVWLNRGACPQAAEVSALLVEGILAEKSRASHMAVRSACSMALVRFVNSVADSFQTGMYAQSIGAIAERVDLPQWLVQVRHAATHEELPSLQVCRAATCVALEWLDTHYWQPSLAPMSAPDDGEELARRAAWATQQAQLLHAYRANARAIARDRSMARKGGAPLERTIAAYVDAAAAESERRIAYLQRRGAAAALGRSLDEAPASVGGACVASVLMACIAQLLLPGALIPAKEPRVDVALWEPLVGALVERFGQFRRCSCTRSRVPRTGEAHSMRARGSCTLRTHARCSRASLAGTLATACRPMPRQRTRRRRGPSLVRRARRRLRAAPRCYMRSKRRASARSPLPLSSRTSRSAAASLNFPAFGAAAGMRRSHRSRSSSRARWR